MRITFDDLVTITNKKTPGAQAGWFKKHFDVDAEYDCKGVIITYEVFNAIVARKYGVPINKDETTVKPRPKVLLLKDGRYERKKA